MVDGARALRVRRSAAVAPRAARRAGRRGTGAGPGGVGVGGGGEGGAQGRGACAAGGDALREVSDAWRERGFGGARAVDARQVAATGTGARRNAAIHPWLWRLGGVARVRDESQRGSGRSGPRCVRGGRGRAAGGVGRVEGAWVWRGAGRGRSASGRDGDRGAAECRASPATSAPRWCRAGSGRIPTWVGSLLYGRDRDQSNEHPTNRSSSGAPFLNNTTCRHWPRSTTSGSSSHLSACSRVGCVVPKKSSSSSGPSGAVEQYAGCSATAEMSRIDRVPVSRDALTASSIDACRAPGTCPRKPTLRKDISNITG